MHQNNAVAFKLSYSKQLNNRVMDQMKYWAKPSQTFFSREVGCVQPPPVLEAIQEITVANSPATEEINRQYEKVYYGKAPFYL